MMQKTSLDNKRNINYIVFLNIKEQIIIIIKIRTTATVVKVSGNI